MNAAASTTSQSTGKHHVSEQELSEHCRNAVGRLSFLDPESAINKLSTTMSCLRDPVYVSGSGGGQPASVSAALLIETLRRESPHRRICQYQFKTNDIVWICRSCQKDETCVLCNECWELSDHTGHEVYFYHSQAGGCCDCGDVGAWDPKGFCCRHTGIPHRDPASLVPSNTRAVARHLMQHVMTYLSDYLRIYAEGFRWEKKEKEEVAGSTAAAAAATAAAADGGGGGGKNEQNGDGKQGQAEIVETAVGERVIDTADLFLMDSGNQPSQQTQSSIPMPMYHTFAIPQNRRIYAVNIHLDDAHTDLEKLATDLAPLRVTFGSNALPLSEISEKLRATGRSTVALFQESRNLAVCAASAIRQRSLETSFTFNEGERAESNIGAVICSVLDKSILDQEPTVVAVVDWMCDLAEIGDGICRIICEALPLTRIMGFLEYFPRLSRALSNSLYRFIVTLMTDYATKTNISLAYALTFPSFSGVYNSTGSHNAEQESTLYQMSVQFMNRASFADEMVYKCGLFSAVMQSIVQLVDEVAKGLPDRNGDFPSWIKARQEFYLHPIMSQRRYNPLIGDLKIIFGCVPQTTRFFCIPNEDCSVFIGNRGKATEKSVGNKTRTASENKLGIKKSEFSIQAMPPPGSINLSVGSSIDNNSNGNSSRADWTPLESDGSPLSQFLYTLSFLQYLHPQTRQTTRHVDRETQDWMKAFNLKLSLASLFDVVMNWLEYPDSVEEAMLPAIPYFPHTNAVPLSVNPERRQTQGRAKLEQAQENHTMEEGDVLKVGENVNTEREEEVEHDSWVYAAAPFVPNADPLAVFGVSLPSSPSLTQYPTKRISVGKGDNDNKTSGSSATYMLPDIATPSSSSLACMHNQYTTGYFQNLQHNAAAATATSSFSSPAMDLDSRFTPEKVASTHVPRSPVVYMRLPTAATFMDAVLGAVLQWQDWASRSDNGLTVYRTYRTTRFVSTLRPDGFCKLLESSLLATGAASIGRGGDSGEREKGGREREGQGGSKSVFTSSERQSSNATSNGPKEEREDVVALYPKSMALMQECAERSFHLPLHRFLATILLESCSHSHLAHTLLQFPLRHFLPDIGAVDASKMSDSKLDSCLKPDVSLVREQALKGTEKDGRKDCNAGDDDRENEENWTLSAQQQHHLLLEYPLTNLAWASEIRAQLWRRNGNQAMMDQLLNYRDPPYCRVFRDLDILQLQYFGGVFGTARLVNHTIHRFSIYDYLTAQKRHVSILPRIAATNNSRTISSHNNSSSKNINNSNSNSTYFSPFNALIQSAVGVVSAFPSAASQPPVSTPASVQKLEPKRVEIKLQAGELGGISGRIDPSWWLYVAQLQQHQQEEREREEREKERERERNEVDQAAVLSPAEREREREERSVRAVAVHSMRVIERRAERGRAEGRGASSSSSRRVSDSVKLPFEGTACAFMLEDFLLLMINLATELPVPPPPPLTPTPTHMPSPTHTPSYTPSYTSSYTPFGAAVSCSSFSSTLANSLNVGKMDASTAARLSSSQQNNNNNDLSANVEREAGQRQRLKAVWRRDIIHFLVSEPKTYSQIHEDINGLSSSKHDAFKSEIDDLIGELAEWSNPTGIFATDQMGGAKKLKLKSQFLAEYDPCFPHISDKDHVLALDKRLRAVKSPQPIVVRPLPCHASMRAYPNLHHTSNCTQFSTGNDNTRRSAEFGDLKGGDSEIGKRNGGNAGGMDNGYTGNVSSMTERERVRVQETERQQTTMREGEAEMGGGMTGGPPLSTDHPRRAVASGSSVPLRLGLLTDLSLWVVLRDAMYATAAAKCSPASLAEKMALSDALLRSVRGSNSSSNSSSSNSSSRSVVAVGEGEGEGEERDGLEDIGEGGRGAAEVSCGRQMYKSLSPDHTSSFSTAAAALERRDTEARAYTNILRAIMGEAEVAYQHVGENYVVKYSDILFLRVLQLITLILHSLSENDAGETEEEKEGKQHFRHMFAAFLLHCPIINKDSDRHTEIDLADTNTSLNEIEGVQLPDLLQMPPFLHTIFDLWEALAPTDLLVDPDTLNPVVCDSANSGRGAIQRGDQTAMGDNDDREEERGRERGSGGGGEGYSDGVNAAGAHFLLWILQCIQRLSSSCRIYLNGRFSLRIQQWKERERQRLEREREREEKERLAAEARDVSAVSKSSKSSSKLSRRDQARARAMSSIQSSAASFARSHAQSSDSDDDDDEVDDDDDDDEEEEEEEEREEGEEGEEGDSNYSRNISTEHTAIRESRVKKGPKLDKATRKRNLRILLRQIRERKQSRQRAIRVWKGGKIECIICRSSECVNTSNSAEDTTIGYIGFSQASRMMHTLTAGADTDTDTIRGDNEPKNTLRMRGFVPKDPDLHVQFCGHAIHQCCFETYLSSAIEQSEAQSGLIMDAARGQFKCPMCRSLCNFLLPLHACAHETAPALSFFRLHDCAQQRQHQHQNLLDLFLKQQQKQQQLEQQQQQPQQFMSGQARTLDAEPKTGDRTNSVSVGSLSVVGRWRSSCASFWQAEKWLRAVSGSSPQATLRLENALKLLESGEITGIPSKNKDVQCEETRGFGKSSGSSGSVEPIGAHTQQEVNTLSREREIEREKGANEAGKTVESEDFAVRELLAESLIEEVQRWQRAHLLEMGSATAPLEKFQTSWMRFLGPICEPVLGELDSESFTTREALATFLQVLLRALAFSCAADLADRSRLTLSLCSGWQDTDLQEPGAVFPPSVSADALYGEARKGSEQGRERRREKGSAMIVVEPIPLLLPAETNARNAAKLDTSHTGNSAVVKRFRAQRRKESGYSSLFSAVAENDGENAGETEQWIGKIKNVDRLFREVSTCLDSFGISTFLQERVMQRLYSPVPLFYDLSARPVRGSVRDKNTQEYDELREGSLDFGTNVPIFDRISAHQSWIEEVQLVGSYAEGERSAEHSSSPVGVAARREENVTWEDINEEEEGVLEGEAGADADMTVDHQQHHHHQQQPMQQQQQLQEPSSNAEFEQERSRRKRRVSSDVEMQRWWMDAPLLCMPLQDALLLSAALLCKVAKYNPGSLQYMTSSAAAINTAPEPHLFLSTRKSPDLGELHHEHAATGVEVGGEWEMLASLGVDVFSSLPVGEKVHLMSIEQQQEGNLCEGEKKRERELEGEGIGTADALLSDAFQALSVANLLQLLLVELCVLPEPTGENGKNGEKEAKNEGEKGNSQERRPSTSIAAASTPSVALPPSPPRTAALEGAEPESATTTLIEPSSTLNTYTILGKDSENFLNWRILDLIYALLCAIEGCNGSTYPTSTTADNSADADAAVVYEDKDGDGDDIEWEGGGRRDAESEDERESQRNAARQHRAIRILSLLHSISPPPSQPLHLKQQQRGSEMETADYYVHTLKRVLHRWLAFLRSAYYSLSKLCTNNNYTHGSPPFQGGQTDSTPMLPTLPLLPEDLTEDCILAHLQVTGLLPFLSPPLAFALDVTPLAVGWLYAAMHPASVHASENNSNNSNSNSNNNNTTNSSSGSSCNADVVVDNRYEELRACVSRAVRAVEEFATSTSFSTAVDGLDSGKRDGCQREMSIEREEMKEGEIRLNTPVGDSAEPVVVVFDEEVESEEERQEVCSKGEGSERSRARRLDTQPWKRRKRSGNHDINNNSTKQPCESDSSLERDQQQSISGRENTGFGRFLSYKMTQLSRRVAGVLSERSYPEGTVRGNGFDDAVSLSTLLRVQLSISTATTATATATTTADVIATGVNGVAGNVEGGGEVATMRMERQKDEGTEREREGSVGILGGDTFKGNNEERGGHVLIGPRPGGGDRVEGRINNRGNNSGEALYQVLCKYSGYYDTPHRQESGASGSVRPPSLQTLSLTSPAPVADAGGGAGLSINATTMGKLAAGDTVWEIHKKISLPLYSFGALLPHAYTQLHASISARCTFKSPALCMLCGEVLDAGGGGHCTKHVDNCGKEVGIFFILHDCVLLLMHGGRCISCPAPYVDQYGERHKQRFRGAPLYLDHERLEMLRRLWSRHGLPREIMSKRSVAQRVIILGYY